MNKSYLNVNPTNHTRCTSYYSTHYSTVNQMNRYSTSKPHTNLINEHFGYSLLPNDNQSWTDLSVTFSCVTRYCWGVSFLSSWSFSSFFRILLGFPWVSWGPLGRHALGVLGAPPEVLMGAGMLVAVTGRRPNLRGSIFTCNNTHVAQLWVSTRNTLYSTLIPLF